MPDPRIHSSAPLDPGGRLRLGPEEARHLTRVLRLGPGAGVRVFNETDGEWRARIIAVDKRGLDLTIESKLREARAAPDLDLLFAPVKRHATDLIVEKATELGARRIRAVITQRTITDQVRTDRWRTIAREAAEQTERFDLPEILDPVPLSKLLDGWDASRALVYADEQGDAASEAWGGAQGRARPIAAALREVQSESLALLIGPEGGFDRSERQLLRSLTFVIPVSLGPRILRAETAAIAALTVLQALKGDWR